MAERRQPAIKLFGKRIQLPFEGEVPVAAGDGISRDEEKAYYNKVANSSNEEEKNETNSSTNEEKDPNASSPDKRSKSVKQQKNSGGYPQEKPLRKPDKILPCPRCSSMDTKFCYFNNYNVNQPRHYCKKCQRYWTAGGSMRNVPIGAGRRKSKSCASNHHYHHITIPNATVLSFGSDAPLCESVPPVVDHVEKTTKNRHRNGPHQPENGEELSSGSSVVTTLNSNEADGFQYFNGTPWPYQWSHPLPFGSTTFPVPFYPLTAYWGTPWLSPPLSSSPTSGSPPSSSSAFGKHSREEKSFWVPKTARMDHPEKAAKSSLWASL